MPSISASSARRRSANWASRVVAWPCSATAAAWSPAKSGRSGVMPANGSRRRARSRCLAESVRARDSQPSCRARRRSSANRATTLSSSFLASSTAFWASTASLAGTRLAFQAFSASAYSRSPALITGLAPRAENRASLRLPIDARSFCRLTTPEAAENKASPRSPLPAARSRPPSARRSRFRPNDSSNCRAVIDFKNGSSAPSLSGVLLSAASSVSLFPFRRMAVSD